MAKPVPPLEWGFGARGGGVTTLTTHPSDYAIDVMIEERSDGGGVQDGLVALQLSWTTLTPAAYDQLIGFYNAAIAAAGLYSIRWWDETLNSGAGAWATVNCMIRTRPKPGNRGGSPNYRQVTWTIDAIGIPS